MDELAKFLLIASIPPLGLGAYAVLFLRRKVQENPISRRKILDGMLLLVATDASCALWLLVQAFFVLLVTSSNHLHG